MSDIEQRLSRLESLIKGMIVSIAIAIVLLAFNLYRLTALETLRVQRLEIVDGQGRLLIVLSRNPLGMPVLMMQDADGRKRFGVSLDAEGNALVAIWDAKGQMVAKMGQ